MVVLLGVWGWYLQSFATEGFIEVSRGRHFSELPFYNDLSKRGAHFIQAAMFMGIVVPVVLAIGFWIYRGFKPSADE